MKKNKTVPKRFLAILMALCCVGFMAGCSNQCQVTFKEQMDNSIEALQAGDVEMAQQNIDSVRQCAKTFNQKRMVDSMDGLISGAQAMMDGDSLQARADWSNIPDPQLNRQVRINADVVMGVKVPMIPEAKEVGK